MPGVGHLRTAADGGHLKGGAPRVIWQALDADPGVISARSAAERLSDLGRSGHLTWNPLTGEIIQLISVLRAGRSLGGPEGLSPLAPGCAEDSGAKPVSAGHTSAGHVSAGHVSAGHVSAGPASAGPAAGEPAMADQVAGVNVEGRLCVQICVVAFASDPFTAGPLAGLRDIMDWLDSWGIPRCWPAGPPVTPAAGRTGCGSRRLWARGGHFGASQVPDWAAAGPGAIDIGRLTGIPAPAAIPLRAAAAARGLSERDVREGDVREGDVREGDVREGDVREEALSGRERGRDEQYHDQRRREEQQDRGEQPGLADLDEIFEHRAPAAGSLTRVG